MPSWKSRTVYYVCLQERDHDILRSYHVNTDYHLLLRCSATFVACFYFVQRFGRRPQQSIITRYLGTYDDRDMGVSAFFLSISQQLIAIDTCLEIPLETRKLDLFNYISLQQDAVPLACLSDMRFQIVSCSGRFLQCLSDLTCLTMVIIPRPIAHL
jgi:hypothetical protein